MNNLLIFFAFPLATIIIAAVLELIVRNPLAVAATAFAVFLIAAFTIYDETFLVAVIAYTILALISALITKLIRRLCRNCNSNGCIVNVLDEIGNNNNNCRR